jgi:hypothetical protein
MNHQGQILSDNIRQGSAHKNLKINVMTRFDSIQSNVLWLYWQLELQSNRKFNFNAAVTSETSLDRVNTSCDFFSNNWKSVEE